MAHSIDSWVRHGVEMRKPLLIHPNLSDAQRIIVIGGGLSGLTFALRCAEKFPERTIDLVESSPRLGGVIETWSEDEWRCDVSVNASRPHPAVWRLIHDLGLDDEWHVTNDYASNRWVHFNGQRVKVGPALAMKIGIFRIIRGVRNARKGGRPVAELIPNTSIADALTLGIVNDVSINVDADTLFPGLTRFGHEPPVSRSKLRRLVNDSYPSKAPPRRSMASLDGGMEQLIDSIVTRLEEYPKVKIHLNSRMRNPEEAASNFQVPIHSVVWATPNFPDLGFKKERTKIRIFAWGERAKSSIAPIGYGMLIPTGGPVSGILHESDIHHGSRAPEGQRLFRIMVPENRWNGELNQIHAHMNDLHGQKNPTIFKEIAEREIPRYLPGHLQKLNDLQVPCTWIGWGASGPSITHVVDEVERIVERMADYRI